MIEEHRSCRTCSWNIDLPEYTLLIHVSMTVFVFAAHANFPNSIVSHKTTGTSSMSVYISTYLAIDRRRWGRVVSVIAMSYDAAPYDKTNDRIIGSYDAIFDKTY